MFGSAWIATSGRVLGRPEPSSREVTATGPTAKWRLDPRHAYTMTGTNAPYRPQTGGRPASLAYDMPCGTTRAATDIPAKRSGMIKEGL